MAALSPNEKLVSRSVLPMFRDPDAHTEQVSQALLAMRVTVLDERGDWRRIQTPDGYAGWVEAAPLADAPADWNEDGGRWGEADDLWVNLRSAADFRRAAVLHAPIGVRLPVLNEGQGWTELLMPDGQHLWTESTRIQAVAGDPRSPSTHRPANTAELLRTAKRFLMVPYLWGGGTFLGLDCSGFVQLVYRLHGIPLRRDAHLQAEEGRPSPAPDKGDLVFFGPVGHPDRITHVGLMLDSRRFIHAKGSHHVTINTLAPDDYGPKLRFARRYL
jgi:cell wall-associated NlpC family hydrolase